LYWDTFQHTSMGTTKQCNGSMDSETSSSSCILVHNILSSTLSFCNRVWNKTTCSQHRGLTCGRCGSCSYNHQRHSHCSLYNYTSFSFWRGLKGLIAIVYCCFPSIWSTRGRACGSLSSNENCWKRKKRNSENQLIDGGYLAVLWNVEQLTRASSWNMAKQTKGV
jgi:hypothetical protein